MDGIIEISKANYLGIVECKMKIGNKIYFAKCIEGSEHLCFRKICKYHLSN